MRCWVRWSCRRFRASLHGRSPSRWAGRRTPRSSDGTTRR